MPSGLPELPLTETSVFVQLGLYIVVESRTKRRRDIELPSSAQESELQKNQNTRPRPQDTNWKRTLDTTNTRLSSKPKKSIRASPRPRTDSIRNLTKETLLTFLLLLSLSHSSLKIPKTKMQIPSHTPDIPLLQLRLLNIPSEQISRISNVIDSRQDILKSNGGILLAPAERSRKAFVFCHVR